jgi:predicted PurR-regulated permease PerM
MITAYLLFVVAALLMVLLVVLIWRFWQGFAQVSPEEEELRRQTAARIEAQNQAKAQAIAEQNLQMSQRLGSAQSMNPK